MKTTKMVRIAGIFAMIIILSCGISIHAKAQSIADDLLQLELDYQKLSGLKSILKQMYQGYEIVSKGYNAVKNVSQGNFNLHQAFLDGLLMVSPTVRKYPRIADIINDQAQLVSEYKSAYSSFKRTGHFTPEEISYMADVYNNLVNASLNNLSMLTTVITDNKLRMSDNERLAAIDGIYASSREQLTFLRRFNDNTQAVADQREQQSANTQTLKTLYGIQ